MGLKVAFVAALSEKKLAQKLAPLQALDEIERIDLFRRKPFAGPKIRWCGGSRLLAHRSVLGSEIYRLSALLLAAHRYDFLVGCHQRFHGLWATIAGRLWGTPVVQLLISEAEWIIARSFRGRALLAADAIGARGPLAAEALRQAGFTGPVEVIANPMELVAPVPPPPAPVRDLLLVGDYAESKDYPWMLEVLAALKPRRPQLKVGVVGQGPFRKHLGPAIRRHGLTEVVELLGSRFGADLDRAYLESRALLLTSGSEGLPMVVLEAMALARPVVVTAVGELCGLIHDRREGRIVPHGATEPMADALFELLADPDQQARMGQAGRKRMEEMEPSFSIEAIALRWRKLLASIIVDRDGP